MLSFIPDSIILYFVNIIFYAGIVGTLLGFVFNLPFLTQYRLIVQIVSLLLLCAGLYFKGGYEVEMQWRARVAEMKQQVALAGEKSKVVNAEVQTKIVTKIKTIHDTKVITKEIIKEVEKVIDAECKVAPEAIIILNAAAKNERPVLNLSLPKDLE